jgi:cardiolipin synthase A/B
VTVPRRRSIIVLVAGAVALVSLAGCRSASAPATAPASSAPPAPTTSGAAPRPVAGSTVVTEPDAGLTPVYDLMASATASLDLAMYELVDTRAETILAGDAARGVKVRVMLDHNLEATANTAAFTFLSGRGVTVRWAPPGFAATHEKALVVDSKTAAIMTLNLMSRYYPNTRDFAVIDTDGADVAAIETVFSADFGGTAISPSNGDDLLWSPGSEARLVALIASARSTVAVESEELSASAIVDALAAAAQRGVAVTVTMTTSTSWAPAFNRLTAAGAHVRTYHGETPIYIHAKVVVVDAGTATGQVFVGSENFTLASLDRNRELGLIVTTPAVVASLQSTLARDFAGATPWVG